MQTAAPFPACANQRGDVLLLYLVLVRVSQGPIQGRAASLIFGIHMGTGVKEHFG